MMTSMSFSFQFFIETACLWELRSMKISNDLPDSQSIYCAGCSIHEIHST
jgi:peroxiredoxin